MLFIIDGLLILSCIFILVNFERGFFLYLLLGLILPTFVEFRIGSLSININDLLLLFLFLSFLIHKAKLKKDFTNIQIRKLLSIYVISTLVLIFLASYVPFSIQFYGFIKGTLFHEAMPVIFAFYAFSNVKLNNLIISKVLIYIAIIIGCYGIICYLIHANPYMSMLNLLYLDEYVFEHFITETRAGLTGRVSGTVNHPLTWGQLWNILLAFFVINRDKIGKTNFNVILILSCLNLLFSGSRSAFIALFPLVICYLLSVGRIKIMRYVIGFSMLLASCYFILPDNMQMYIKSAVFFWDDSISDAADINGSNVNMRLDQLETTLNDVSKANLIAGFGLGYREYSVSKGTKNEDMLGYESVFFSKMYEQGLLGTICFFIYLSQFYVLGCKTLVSKKKLLFTGYFFSYLLSILFTGIQNSLGWFVFFGLLIITSDKAEYKRLKCCNKSKFISKL